MYKFLLYDECNDDVEHFLNCAEMIFLPITVERVSSYEEFLSTYKNGSYDMLFIDFANTTGEKIVSYIQTSNPKQKTILLSSALRCIGDLDCATCKNSYDLLRVAKPFNYSDLSKIIKNPMCEFDFTDSFLSSIVMVITKKYRAVKFDKESLQIRCSGSNSVSHEMVELCNELSANNVNCSVESHKIIQLIDQV